MRAVKIKVLIFFIVFLGFMSLNTGFYWLNIVSLRDRLVVMDHFHDLLSDILEIRRYEKNFLFYPEPESLKEAVIYLDKAEGAVAVLKDNIIEIGGQDYYNKFMKNISDYSHQLNILSSGSKGDLLKTRNLGTEMVQSAQNLLALKQKRIHTTLIKIQYIPIVVMLSLALLIVILFYWQAKKVLGRLVYVQKAAEGVAKGDYSSIDQITSDDEISSLMHSAFSSMAADIEHRQNQLIESRKLSSIGTLTSGIAHELNNPLNNVSLTADTMLEEFEDMEAEEAKEMLNDIINEIGRASEVVRNLLDFSRESEQSISELSVETLMNETKKLVVNQLRLDKVTLNINILPDIPKVLGDLNSLQQVFINLFMNADHAMEGGGTLTVTVSSTPDNYVRFDVTDTGCGMTSETLERIFDPFFTTKPVGKGTGLGLSIIYGLIKKHNGFIEVQSKLEVGTTFSIFLPAVSQLENSHGQISSGNN